MTEDDFALSESTFGISAGALLNGRYRVVRRLGQGGMGKIFMALDAHLHNRPCAIKRLREDFRREHGKEDTSALFKREARMLSRLRHPNVVQISDFFEAVDNFYLVMEYVEGKDLQQLTLERGQPFETRQIIEWSLQLCSVLEYLHQYDPSIVYGDLKPSNIMVGVDGVLKLVDFGFAHPYNPAAAESSVVSASYSAPEQYHGVIDPRSDIYGLGATMHFLLTGLEPIIFTASRPHFLVPSVSSEVSQIVETATAQNPELRFQTAYSMRQALGTVAHAYKTPNLAFSPRTIVTAIIFAVILGFLGRLAAQQLHIHKDASSLVHQSPPNSISTKEKVPQFHIP